MEKKGLLQAGWPGFPMARELELNSAMENLR
jgi:hypothetical protein